MIKIKVREELGQDIVTREHGERLFQLIKNALGDAPVVIDFDGLQVTSVSFFDEAFGQLAFRKGQAVVDENIKLERIDPFDEALVRDIVISRSREAKKRPSGSRWK